MRFIDALRADEVAEPVARAVLAWQAIARPEVSADA